MEEIFIPATGMTMEDAELVAWLKEPGDVVAVGDAIATIETDKVTVDVTAETSGILDVHLVEAGALVQAGAVITRVLHDAAESGAPPEPAAPPADSPASVASSAAPPEPVPAEPVPAGPAVATPPAAPPPATVPALVATQVPSESVGTDGRPTRPHALTPRQRREARERGATATASPVQAPTGEPARKGDAVAKAVTESWATIPHFAVSREIDVTGMLHYLDELRAGGAHVSVTDLLLRAAARAWATLRPSASDAIGLLVATPRRAINITVHGASTTDLPALADVRAAVVARARRGLLKPGDLASCEASVSNLGTHDVDWFTGIIPVGQLGLFTIGRVRDTVALVGEDVVARRTLWVTVNLDHRQFDGAEAAQLLAAFAEACSITLNDPSSKELPT